MLSCRHVQSGATAVLVTTALLCHTLATAASLRTRAATATLADMPMPKMAADFTVHVSENYTETTRFHWHHVTSVRCARRCPVVGRAPTGLDGRGGRSCGNHVGGGGCRYVAAVASNPSDPHSVARTTSLLPAV